MLMEAGFSVKCCRSQILLIDENNVLYQAIAKHLCRFLGDGQAVLLDAGTCESGESKLPSPQC
jgi:hypothetical protein